MTRLQLSLTLPKTTALISKGLVSAYPFVMHCFQKHLRLFIDFLACLVEGLEKVYELFSHSISLNAGLPVYGGTGSFCFLNFFLGSHPGRGAEELLHCGDLPGLLIGFLFLELGECEGLRSLAALAASKGLFLLPLKPEIQGEDRE